MSEEEVLPEKTDDGALQEEEEEGEVIPTDFGEGQELDIENIVSEIPGETEEKDLGLLGEYGEGAHYYVFRPTGEAAEYPAWEERGESVTTVGSEGESEAEETEEEKELRREREMLIEAVRQNMLERMFIRRKNAFLHKKLIEYYRKRRMNNVFKAEPKGLDLEKKYLNRLYAFQEFKQAQENEIEELTESMRKSEESTNDLEQELKSKLSAFMVKAKEISLNLILSKSGKKLNEKKVDLLLARQIKKNEEKGQKKLTFIKVKNSVEEKERQLKALEYIGEGLHLADYEQMKIDYQSLTDKIEEKEEEIERIAEKTETIMINLAQVREKAHALEEDIELSRETVYAVEKKFAETRERLTKARTRRDYLRDECVHLKTASGLLTKRSLLLDFESSINEARFLYKSIEKLKKLTNEKEAELSKIFIPKASMSSPFEFAFKLLHKSKSRM